MTLCLVKRGASTVVASRPGYWSLVYPGRVIVWPFVFCGWGAYNDPSPQRRGCYPVLGKVRMIGWMRRQLPRLMLEPVNTLTHLFGTLAALLGTLYLVLLTWQEPGKMVTLLVYGVCLVGLYLASTLFHGARVGEDTRMWLNRVDHAAIFLLIAGTYTPILANLFPAGWGRLVLVLIWLVALAGIGSKLTSRRIHGVLNVSIYLILGWGGVLPLLLATWLGLMVIPAGALWLLLGGLVYSAGFVVYYTRRPDPWPGRVGHHEIWHLFVLGGSLCHYLFMLWYVVPA